MCGAASRAVYDANDWGQSLLQGVAERLVTPAGQGVAQKLRLRHRQSPGRTLQFRLQVIIETHAFHGRNSLSYIVHDIVIRPRPPNIVKLAQHPPKKKNPADFSLSHFPC
jgi:hypothetical protein